MLAGILFILTDFPRWPWEREKKEMAVGDLFFQHQFVVTYSQWMALDIMNYSLVPWFYCL